MTVVIRLTGLPATGKTHLRTSLAERTGLPATGIDDQRRRLLLPGESFPHGRDGIAWRRLRETIRSSDAVIVETSGASPHEHRLYLAGDLVFTVLCVADYDTRRRRLLERSRDPSSGIGIEDAARLLAHRPPKVDADLVVDTTDDAGIGQAVREVAQWARSRAVAAVGRA